MTAVMVCICLAREWHYLQVWPCWSRCVTEGVGFKSLILDTWKQVFSSWPSDKDVELSAPPAPCLPGCWHALTLMIMDWTSEPVCQPQLNILLRVDSVMVSVHSSKTLTKTYRITVKSLYKSQKRFEHWTFEHYWDCDRLWGPWS